MKRTKKIIIVVGISLLCCGVLIFVFGSSFVIKSSISPLKKYQCNHSGDTIQIFQEGIIEKHNWVIYLVLDKEDRRQNLKLEAHPFWVLKDNNIIRKISEEWKFICTGGDVATVQSYIYIYMDGDLYFESGIVIDDSFEGLQSEDFGWVISVRENMIYDYIQHFKPIYFPILLLR